MPFFVGIHSFSGRENIQCDLPSLLWAVEIDLVSNLTATPTAPSELLLPITPQQKPEIPSRFSAECR